ncbi:hypothetical protein [Methylovulum miyakonense]|uniref:hypothetical protein n=1 Tax=Methylovulum miyakonense TaxID=645578 RepID=UPI003BB58831
MIKTARFLFQALRNNVSIRGIMGCRRLVKLLNLVLKDVAHNRGDRQANLANMARQFWAEAIRG